ncbi:MAG: amidohydrolase family protein, partial [Erysipelotrichaceae bacterium]|nr:amidohydrolase family protein [Erysipelotrichaceae bacterium]
TFDENMRTMLANGFPLETIGKIFSENAADAYMLKDRGKIEVGRRADLVVMNKDLFVEKTMINGEWFYEKD